MCISRYELGHFSIEFCLNSKLHLAKLNPKIQSKYFEWFIQRFFYFSSDRKKRIKLKMHWFSCFVNSFYACWPFSSFGCSSLTLWRIYCIFPQKKKTTTTNSSFVSDETEFFYCIHSRVVDASVKSQNHLHMLKWCCRFVGWNFVDALAFNTHTHSDRRLIYALNLPKFKLDN